MLNRRQFIAGCAGTLALASSLPALAQGGTSGFSSSFLSSSGGQEPLQPSRKLFSRLVGQRFEVYGGQGLQLVHHLQLTEVVDQENSSSYLEQFTLHFEGSLDQPLPSDVYTLRHPRAGGMDLRLDRLPVGSGGTPYAAVFALLR